jgi:uncharacterized SAM-binding protein YcdF (DUF218 family)
MVLLLIKKERAAKYFVMTATVLIFLLSFVPFTNLLLWGLERNYAPLKSFDGLQDVKFIVVLTAWDSDVPTVPYTSNIGYASSSRLLEAYRIYRRMPQPTIIISGGPVSAEMMSKVLMLWGVPREKIVRDDNAANTKESAIHMKALLSTQRFILVTSAIHLPRAMGAFARQGLRPVPAPADFLYGYYKNYEFHLDRRISFFVPNTDAFMRSCSAIYEYLGMIWYAVRG